VSSLKNVTRSLNPDRLSANGLGGGCDFTGIMAGSSSPDHGLRLPMFQMLSPTENALAMKVPIP
jgi:hypothetical protein